MPVASHGRRFSDGVDGNKAAIHLGMAAFSSANKEVCPGRFQYLFITRG
jgi:hypothetical protein